MSNDMLRGENGERGVLATARDSRVMVPPLRGLGTFGTGKSVAGGGVAAHGTPKAALGLCVCIWSACACLLLDIPNIRYCIPTRKCEYEDGVL